MKWETNTNRVSEGRHQARCGHLYVRVEEVEAYREPGHPDYEAPSCKWFVEPDNEDKSYRRALATGETTTLDAAKAAVHCACAQLITEMQASLLEG